MVANNTVGSVEALYGADAATAAQARAEYIYSSYGEVMMKSGDLADKNNIGYSTRYREGNTGLVSYTYRHYSPRLKKWLSKDPIAEQGGLNLYQMTANDPVSHIDLLGYTECGCYKDGAPIPEVKDDAGVLCCMNLIETVSLHSIPAFTKNHVVGHSFVQTPNHIKGFYPDLKNNSFMKYFGLDGMIKDDTDLFNNKNINKVSFMYITCPSTIEKIDRFIETSEKNVPKYHIFNIFSPNCAGWAVRAIEAGGLTPPYPSYIPMRP